MLRHGSSDLSVHLHTYLLVNEEVQMLTFSPENVLRGIRNQRYILRPVRWIIIKNTDCRRVKSDFLSRNGRLTTIGQVRTSNTEQFGMRNGAGLLLAG